MFNTHTHPHHPPPPPTVHTHTLVCVCANVYGEELQWFWCKMVDIFSNFNVTFRTFPLPKFPHFPTPSLYVVSSFAPTFHYRKFPWLLQVYNLQAYNFYKVIEVLIRAEDGLSREVVKHLNQVSVVAPPPHPSLAHPVGDRLSVRHSNEISMSTRRLRSRSWRVKHGSLSHLCGTPLSSMNMSYPCVLMWVQLLTQLNTCILSTFTLNILSSLPPLVFVGNFAVTDRFR